MGSLSGNISAGKLVVIGGPARSGKSTLARRLKSTPRFRSYSVFGWDAYASALHDAGLAEVALGMPDAIAASELTARERDELVFELVVPYISRVLAQGYDVLAEGRFRPGFDYTRFGASVVAEVYLMRSVPDVEAEARLLESIEANDPSGGWLARNGWSVDEFAKHHATSVAEWRAEAEQHGKQFFDAADEYYSDTGGFAKLMSEAVRYLCRCEL